MKQLDKTRSQIAALKAQVSGTEAIGRSRAEVRSAVLGYLRGIEADGARALSERVSDLADGAAPRGLLHPLGTDIGPVLVALMGPDAVAAALDRYVEKVPDGLDAAGRAGQSRAMRSELFALEVAEEALIVAAEARGESVLRRADADPAAVLHPVPGG